MGSIVSSLKSFFTSEKVWKAARLIILIMVMLGLAFYLAKVTGLDKRIFTLTAPGIFAWVKKLTKILAETAAGEWVKTRLGHLMKKDAVPTSAPAPSAPDRPSENIIASVLVFLLVLALYAAL